MMKFKKMDDVFKNLEKQGKANVDNLIKWMKDSKLIDSTKEQEAKARKMFKDSEDIMHVKLERFQNIVRKLAEEQKKTYDQMSKQLADEGPRLMKAAKAGIKAFQESLKEKK